MRRLEGRIGVPFGTLTVTVPALKNFDIVAMAKTPVLNAPAPLLSPCPAASVPRSFRLYEADLLLERGDRMGALSRVGLATLLAPSAIRLASYKRRLRRIFGRPTLSSEGATALAPAQKKGPEIVKDRWSAKARAASADRSMRFPSNGIS
jgi:hypothetical protein